MQRSYETERALFYDPCIIGEMWHKSCTYISLRDRRSHSIWRYQGPGKIFAPEFAVTLEPGALVSQCFLVTRKIFDAAMSPYDGA